MIRRAVGAGMISLAAIAWLVASAVPGTAHALLASSSPADGAVLEAPPTELRLTFTEPVDLELTDVELVGSAGTEVATGPPARGSSAREVVLALDTTLGEGVYTVTWQTVSTTDTHLTRNAFTFGVGVEPGTVPPSSDPGVQTPTPSALAVAGRIALYAGLAVLIGAAMAALFAVPASRIARPGILGLAWALVAFAALATTLAERTAVGVPLGTLLGSDAGGAYVRLSVAAAVLGAAVLLAAVRATRLTAGLVAAAAIATAFVRVEGGHAGGSLVEVLVQTLHVAGAGTWIGGLAWLALSMRHGLEAPAVRRFSNLAAAGLGVVVVTGILRASSELGFTWWLHPLRSGYSTTLALKVLAVVPLVGLGALNRLRNVPRFGAVGSRPLRRVVAGELAIAVLVFGLTGVMTGLPPNAEAPPERERRQVVVVSGSDFATTTFVRLEVSAGVVGANAFAAEVLDHDTREPLDATAVSLRFSFPDRPGADSTLALERASGGSWRAEGTNLSLFGTWNVTATVALGAGTTEVPLLVTPRPPQQAISVSRQEGQPVLYTVAQPGGGELQAYVDPGEPGRTNQVHLTAFDDAGAELPLRSAVITGSVAGGSIERPDPIRFGPGHFVVNLELAPGTWTFALRAETRDGRSLEAVFEQRF